MSGYACHSKNHHAVHIIHIMFIHAVRLTCPFSPGRPNKFHEQRKIIDNLSCKSKNLVSTWCLIYLRLKCNKCKCHYIGETKRQLNERFGEHRRSILNHHQLGDPTPVSLHLNQPKHSINEVRLIPLALTRRIRDAVRKARAH